MRKDVEGNVIEYPGRENLNPSKHQRGDLIAFNGRGWSDPGRIRVLRGSQLGVAGARFARFSAWGQGLRMRSEAGDPSASINIYDAESLAGGIWAQHQRGKGVANAVVFNSRAEIHCGYYLAIHYDEVIIRQLVPDPVQSPGSAQNLFLE